jgi:organic hydroperoxide reductase OsmC/OhrA
MNIHATIDNSPGRHRVVLATNGGKHELDIAPRPEGTGSSINGGELLCLALATCYCNDLYREAARRAIDVTAVSVEAHAEFGSVGEAARALRYSASVTAMAAESDIRDLMTHTDRVAEVQNTLRRGLDVRFDIGEVREQRAP